MNELQSSPALSRSAYLVRYWLPPVLYAAFIFFLSSLPGKKFLFAFSSADKLLHLLEYAGLGYLIARAFGYNALGKKSLLIRSFAACFLYGLSDEFHQWFVPYRVVSFMDMLANVTGSLLGIGIYIKQRKVL